jgi:hypothetical protein
MNAPAVHNAFSETPAAREVRCPVDGTMFAPARSWQKFCSNECRNRFHQSMTPEALRRDIEALRAEVEAMAATIAQVQKDVDRRDKALAPPGSPPA